MTAFNIFALTVVGLFVAVFIAVPVARWRERYLTWSEHRAAHRQARDFAATDAAHLSESVEVWAARTRLQPTRPALPRKEGP